MADKLTETAVRAHVLSRVVAAMVAAAPPEQKLEAYKVLQALQLWLVGKRPEVAEVYGAVTEDLLATFNEAEADLKQRLGTP